LDFPAGKLDEGHALQPLRTEYRAYWNAGTKEYREALTGLVKRD
jgi:hypothetical protein